MSRFLHAAARVVRNLASGWNAFWFRGADPATLCLMRILGGAMLFYTHLVWSLDFEAFFGPDGWLSPEAVRLLQKDTYAWSYFWWLPSPAWRWTAHVAALAVFALLTVGLFSRVTSILALVATLSYVGRAPGSLFGLDQINTMLAMYLAVGPCGAMVSLDRWRLERRCAREHRPAPAVGPSIGANIAIRLTQLHMCVIYAFAGTSKLMGPSWWDGTAMWQAMANLEYQSIDLTWMAHWPRLIALMTHVTILWEVYYVALIWPRRTRYGMLALAVPLHLGIGMFLGMMTFGLVMLIANLAFVEPQFVRAVLSWRPGQGRGVAANAATADFAAAKSAPAVLGQPSGASLRRPKPRLQKR